MKPTKVRNQMIYHASQANKSKRVSSPLSSDLKKKYSKNSVRVIEGDSVKIVRGEFKGVDGKVSEVSVQQNSIAIEGVKKEKTKGEKFDIFIHSSNVIVTDLNSTDKWRMAKLEGKKPSSKPKESSDKTEEKKEPSKNPDDATAKKSNKDSKETKVEKTPEKEIKE